MANILITWLLTNKFSKQADQDHIGERLIETIELKQAEREIIQTCYARHRLLDKFHAIGLLIPPTCRRRKLWLLTMF